MNVHVVFTCRGVVRNKAVTMWSLGGYGALILFFSIVQTSAQSLQRDVDESENRALFSADRHKRLSVTAIASYNVSDAIFCSLECVRSYICLSFNFALGETQNLSKCELLASDKYTSPAQFQVNVFFNHYSIRNPCNKTPCNHGNVCQPSYHTDTYSCKCGEEFVGEHCEWRKLNTAPVCFAALGNQYGVFRTTVPGQIKALKLVHLSGAVSCYVQLPGSHWGSAGGSRLDVIITNSANTIITPPLSTIDQSLYYYSLPGYQSNSPELILPGFNPPLAVTVGQEFRIWFGEDLKDALDGDNAGTSCANVFAHYDA